MASALPINTFAQGFPGAEKIGCNTWADEMECASERSTSYGSAGEITSDDEQTPKSNVSSPCVAPVAPPPGVFAQATMPALRAPVMMQIPVSVCPAACMVPMPEAPAAAAVNEASPEYLEARAVALSHAAAQLRQAARKSKKAAAAQRTPACERPRAVQKVSSEHYTTLMLKNLPNDYTRDMLCMLLDNEQLAGTYDLVYLPRDFEKDAGFGYAFVNFERPEYASVAKQRLQGFNKWKFPSRKILEAVWSEPHQGLTVHVERLRNNPVMHEQVPDEFKPIVLKNGLRTSFPRPTKRVRAPRGVMGSESSRQV